MLNHDLAALTGEVLNTDIAFRDADLDFQDAKVTFTAASEKRYEQKKLRKQAISILESLLKKLKSEA